MCVSGEFSEYPIHSLVSQLRKPRPNRARGVGGGSSISPFAREEPGLESGTLVPVPPGPLPILFPCQPCRTAWKQRVKSEWPWKDLPGPPQLSLSHSRLLMKSWFWRRHGRGAGENSQVLVAFGQQLPDILTQTFFPHLVGIQPWCWRHCPCNQSWKRPRPSLSWSSLSNRPP